MVVFLNCAIIYDSIQQGHKIRLINKIITEAKIKKVDPASETHETGDFKYSVLNKKNQVISQTFMPNPLNKTVEYFDENGSMGKKDIRLDSTHISLRIPLEPDARYISFTENNKELLLIDLRK